MRVVTRTRTAAAAACAVVVVAVTDGAGSAETLVERGAYLVTTVAACGNCHTPRDASGKPMVNMTLAGGFEFDDSPIGHVVVPNITPDPETGIGKWTEAEIVSALHTGKRPDGTVIGPPMPLRATCPLQIHLAACCSCQAVGAVYARPQLAVAHRPCKPAKSR